MLNSTALVKCASYDKDQVESALDQALNLIGGLDWVKPGMRIVIKPNLLMPKHPDTACTTHPALLDALIRQLLARDAEVILGDSPGGPFSEFWLKTVYDGTMMTRLKRDGVSLNYNTGARTVHYPPGKVLKHIDVAEFILQADAVISFAKLKTHGFMSFTGAVKNLFGVIPGTVKAEYHQRLCGIEDFANMLVDIAEFVQPRLSITDAVIGMEGNGPAGGNPRLVGAIIASTSPHHADFIGSALIGMDPYSVPTLKAAIERGLCPDSIDALDLRGEKLAAMAIPDFKQANHSISQKSKIQSALAKIMKKAFQSNPLVQTEKCTGCGDCSRACPPKAICMINDGPLIDRKKCIHCFCCQELCPQNAIILERSRLAKLLQKLG